MLARSGEKSVSDRPASRLSELGIVLPAPPTPLGAYVYGVQSLPSGAPVVVDVIFEIEPSHSSPA